MQNLDQNRIKNSRQKVENDEIFQVEILVKKAPGSKSKNKLKKSADSDQNIFHSNNNFSWCNGVTSSSPDLIHFSLIKSKETPKTLIRSRLWSFRIFSDDFSKIPKKVVLNTWFGNVKKFCFSALEHCNVISKWIFRFMSPRSCEPLKILNTFLIEDPKKIAGTQSIDPQFFAIFWMLEEIFFAQNFIDFLIFFFQIFHCFFIFRFGRSHHRSTASMWIWN